MGASRLARRPRTARCQLLRVKEINQLLELDASVASAAKEKRTSFGGSTGHSCFWFEIIVYMRKRAPRKHSFALHDSIRKPLMPNVFFHHCFMPPIYCYFQGVLPTLSFSILHTWTEILDSAFVCWPIFDQINHAWYDDVAQYDCLRCANPVSKAERTSARK